MEIPRDGVGTFFQLAINTVDQKCGVLSYSKVSSVCYCHKIPSVTAVVQRYPMPMSQAQMDLFGLSASELPSEVTAL